MLDKGKKHIYTQAHPYHLSPSLFFIIFFPYPLSFQFLPLPFSLLSSSFLLSSSLFPPCFPVTFISIFCLFPLFFPFFILLRCFSLSLSPPSSLLLNILPLLYFYSPFSFFSGLFPSIILSSLFPPYFPVTFIYIFCLFPSFSPSSSSSVASLLFLPPPFAHYHSPPSLLLLSPFSLEIIKLYLLPVRLSPSFAPFSTLFQPLYSFFPLFHFSLHLSSPFSYLLFCLPSLLICPIHYLFLPLPSLLLPPLSFDTTPSRKIYLFPFSPCHPKLSPLIHCLHLPHSTKNSSPPYPPSQLFLLLISLTQTIKIPTNNKLFPPTPYQISFPVKNATHANPLRTQNRFKRPKYPPPAPTTDTTQITNY